MCILGRRFYPHADQSPTSAPSPEPQVPYLTYLSHISALWIYATSLEDPTLELFAYNLGLIVLLCSNPKLPVFVIAVIALHPIGFEDTAAKAQYYISQLN